MVLPYRKELKMPGPDQVCNRIKDGAFQSLFSDCQPRDVMFSYGQPAAVDADIEKRLGVLEAKMDQILAKLNLIFGDQVLINGRFCSTNFIGQNQSAKDCRP